MRVSKKGSKKVAVYLLLIFISFFAFFPILNGVLISFKKPVDAFTIPPKIIFTPTMENHKYIWSNDDFSKYFINSLIISLITVAISVPLACFAGYGFARYEGKGSLIGLVILMAIRCFPNMILIIPFFLISMTLGLYDTLLIMVIIMVAFNQPFSIWLMRSFFFDIPRELEEAAIIDGCSNLRAFIQVIMPSALSGVVATMIFSFLVTYNDLVFALVLTGTEAKTVPVAVSKYGQELVQYWSFSAASVTTAIVPIILLMVFLQKPLLKGFTGGVTN